MTKHVEICAAIASLRGSLSYIIERGQLPVPQVPDYCIEGFQW